MWFAIVVTVLASSGNNIGKVLQKQATRSLPRLTLKHDIVLQYLRSRTWVVGMLADLAGALLMIVAFASAPVSVVQPVSAVGLVILLIFSHFYLKERLRSQEWGAAFVAFLGVVGLGLSAEPSHLEHTSISAYRVLGAFIVMLSCLVLECWWRHSYLPHQHPHPHLHHHSHAGPIKSAGSGSVRGALKAGTAVGGHTLPPGGPNGAVGGTGSGGISGILGSATGRHPDSHDALLCGLEAGAYFGLSAAATRTGFILSAKLSVVWIPLGLLSSVVLTTSGFVLQTRGLKTGNTVIVCTMAAVSSMISGVAAGLIALDEKMPTQHHMRAIRFISWSFILLGVTALAGGTGGLAAVVSAFLACMPVPPAWVLQCMPRAWAVAMQRSAKHRMEDCGPSAVEVDGPQQV